MVLKRLQGAAPPTVAALPRGADVVRGGGARGGGTTVGGGEAVGMLHAGGLPTMPLKAFENCVYDASDVAYAAV